MKMTEICGVANVDNEYKYIVLNPSTFLNTDVKEIIYSTELGDVESLFGFEDLNIIEIDGDNSLVHSARVFLRNDDNAQAVVFLDKGSLIITDLKFFSGYVRSEGKDTPYTSLVESDTYEDEIAANLIGEYMRLQQ